MKERSSAVARFFGRRKNDLLKLRRYLRSIGAAREQNRLADEIGLKNATELVLFFTASIDDCNGGVMSIANLAATSRRLLPGATVLMTTYPGDPTVVKNTTFPNDEMILRFPLICRIAHPKKLILHIPEMDADSFYEMLSPVQREWIRAVPDCQINILNQNISYMRPRADWAELFELTKNVTQTTAHQKYTTQEMCNKYGIPLHRFGTCGDRSQWPFLPFAEKENLIVFSPDSNEYEPKVRELIRKELPKYRIEVVHDLTFTEYLELVARARFVLTFGEGMDGYFSEPPSVGTVSMAVYNERYFPDIRWLDLENVYASYQELLSRIVFDIRRWESNEAAYNNVRQVTHDINAPIVNSRVLYEDNLRRFYIRRYDYYPVDIAI